MKRKIKSWLAAALLGGSILLAGCDAAVFGFGVIAGAAGMYYYQKHTSEKKESPKKEAKTEEWVEEEAIIE